MEVYPLYDGNDFCLSAILEACFRASLDTDQQRCAATLARSLLEHDTTIRQLANYLSETGIGAQCAVIEREYLDRNFSDDYSAYYGGCFRDCHRRCCRVHFFKECYEAGDIERNLVASEEDGSLKKFKASYLGFVVIRPLMQTIIGRTCLVPYPCEKSYDAAGRHYLAVCTNDVSFFGVRLVVKCMPFQEQDCGTSACATCALWSTFCVSARMFGNKCPSPSTITALAMDNSFSIGTRFPNRGLTAEEMVYAIRRNGLEPVNVCLKGYEKSEVDYLFSGFIYAYLNLGVSVIAIIDDKDGQGKHAIAINGYNLKKDSGEALSAMRIDKYYANDDQCCPGARFQPDWNGDILEIKAYRGPSFAQVLHKTYYLERLIVPLYHKIRVAFTEIAQLVLESNGILFFTDLCVRRCNRDLLLSICNNDEFIKEHLGYCFNKDDVVDAVPNYGKICFEDGDTLKEFTKELRKKYDEYRLKEGGMVGKIIQWDITLKASNDIKDEVRVDTRIPEGKRVSFLEQHLPRYVWCVRISYGGQSSSIVFIDATDSVRGLYVVGALFYNVEVQDIARYAYANDKRVATNPLIKALCAYLES